MQVQIDLDTFSYTQQGFVEHSAPGRCLLSSATLPDILSVDSLASSEYGVAVEIDAAARRVRFGRDYLGQFPLLYALTGSWLIIGDEISEVRSAVLRLGGSLTVSEEGLALYFTMGFVPQGLTLLEQIKTCRNASVYDWRSGRVHESRIFRAVEIDHSVTVSDLARAIEGEVASILDQGSEADVWCSGGLDSSIVACCAAQHSREKVAVITMQYESDIRNSFGDGELPYAKIVASHARVPLREITMTRARYEDVHRSIVQAHVSPVIDTAILPKYMLAAASRKIVATGEGGDPLFAGVKNTPFLFLRQNDPSRPLGYHYAMVHNRYFTQLREIFVHGAELEAFVVEYFNRLFAEYPGDVLRQLFYLNTFEKQGGLIFPESYFAGKRADVSVRHPLTARSVYELAFRLPDHKKYQFPDGKLALIEAFGPRLPREVVERRKSGTILPLRDYLGSVITSRRLPIQSLDRLPQIRPEALERRTRSPWYDLVPLEAHAWITLDQWLTFNGDKNEQSERIPGSAGHQQ